MPQAYLSGQVPSDGHDCSTLTTVVFQCCRLEIEHDYLRMETVFDDGTFAPATPNYEPSDIQRAHDLGYDGDTWQMALDHEALHTWIAERMGFTHSVVLWGAAHGHLKPHGGLTEEGYVISFQVYLRTGLADDLVYGFFDCAEQVTGLPRDVLTEQARQLLADIRARG